MNTENENYLLIENDTEDLQELGECYIIVTEQFIMIVDKQDKVTFIDEDDLDFEIPTKEKIYKKQLCFNPNTQKYSL